MYITDYKEKDKLLNWPHKYNFTLSLPELPRASRKDKG
jgi:hypothetical protein